MSQKPPVLAPLVPVERQRVTVDVSPSLLSLLDHYCEVTGQARTSVIVGLLSVHLPALHDQAKDLKARAAALASPQKRN